MLDVKILKTLLDRLPEGTTVVGYTRDHELGVLFYGPDETKFYVMLDDNEDNYLYVRYPSGVDLQGLGIKVVDMGDASDGSTDTLIAEG